ncbi:malignant T-cell-amplified sequence 1-like [Halichondria panicea]|uniref:malignant T-cell-amplified sequence 1-like n=1 Tax=Halichondria panicea TaxID=6063 RepID=UPI00312BB621
MFKKFDSSNDVSGFNQAKSSVVRGIRTKLLDCYPGIQDFISDILPKKEAVQILKCHEHVEILVIKNELLFFKQRDGPYIPTLRLLHKYPMILPHVQVDKGAIKFVLSGANIMCPGLTSPGARMDTALPDNSIVAVMAEGKEHALSVGLTKMSTEDISRVNKGVGVDNVHYIGDGLWVMKDASR